MLIMRRNMFKVVHIYSFTAVASAVVFVLLLLAVPEAVRTEEKAAVSVAAAGAPVLPEPSVHHIRGTRVEMRHYFKPDPVPEDPNIGPNDARYPRWEHAAYRLGTCSICHTGNDKKNPGPIRTDVNRLCLSCHSPIRDMIESRKFVHKPVVEDCTYCHNPHNSRYRVLLHDTPQALCRRCHVELAEQLDKATVHHDPVIKGNTCLNCHTEHASSIDNLLQGLPSYLCLRCHSGDGLKDSNGAVLDNIGRMLRENRYHHEPVDKKDCSVCHQSHGGMNFRLLDAASPDAFYTAYDKKKYALCLSCHDRERALTEPRTTTLTGFRDGDVNLHEVHVVAPARGRTCRACHGEHAAEQPHMIRKDVPYGDSGWRLPINFVLTPTGGRCVRNCHLAKEYNNGGGFALHRIAPGQTVPNATLDTLSGGRLSVYSKDAAVNLFVFFEPDKAHSMEALDMLSRINQEFRDRSVRTVAVVSDFYKKNEELPWLRSTGWTPEKTLVDKGDAFYNGLGQYMHPSYWLVDRDGKLIAYEPYAATNYFVRIEALVRHSLGDIDDKALAALLNPAPEKELDAASRARMNLAYARKLFEQGKGEQALAHGLRAIEIDGTYTEARGFMCLFYAKTGDCDLAARHCETALAAEPQNAEAKQGASLCK